MLFRIILGAASMSGRVVLACLVCGAKPARPRQAAAAPPTECGRAGLHLRVSCLRVGLPDASDNCCSRRSAHRCMEHSSLVSKLVLSWLQVLLVYALEYEPRLKSSEGFFTFISGHPMCHRGPARK